MKYLIIALVMLAACAPQQLRRSTLPLTVVEVAPPEPATTPVDDPVPTDDADPEH